MRILSGTCLLNKDKHTIALAQTFVHHRREMLFSYLMGETVLWRKFFGKDKFFH